MDLGKDRLFATTDFTGFPFHVIPAIASAMRVSETDMIQEWRGQISKFV